MQNIIERLQTETIIASKLNTNVITLVAEVIEATINSALDVVDEFPDWFSLNDDVYEVAEVVGAHDEHLCDDLYYVYDFSNMTEVCDSIINVAQTLVYEAVMFKLKEA